MRVTTKGRISDLVFSVIIFSRISRMEFLIVGMFWSVAGALGWSNPKMGFLGFAVKWGIFLVPILFWYPNRNFQEGLFACSVHCTLGGIFLSWGVCFGQATLENISIHRSVPKSQMGTKVNLEPAPPSPPGSKI